MWIRDPGLDLVMCKQNPRAGPFNALGKQAIIFQDLTRNKENIKKHKTAQNKLKNLPIL